MRRSTVSLVASLLIGLAIVLLGLVYVVLPTQVVDEPRINRATRDPLKREELRLKAVNDARTTGLQALGVLVLIGGSLLTWRTVRLTREGQITDRYAKAVENLDAAKGVAVQLGAITALERVAHDSRRDHWSIMELLVGRLREAAPSHNPDAPPTGPAHVAPLVQHIASAISRRHARWDPKDAHLHLEGLDLRSVHFDGADLKRANLSASNISGSFFAGANLSKAKLSRTTARGADLTRASLKEAEVRGADFSGAILDGTDFRSAVYGMTKFKDARTDRARGLPPARGRG